MADKARDRNQTPAGGQGGLKGGTQGGGAGPLTNVGGPSGGTNSVSPTGGSQPDRGPAAPPGGAPPDQRGTANQAKHDAEAAFEDGTRKVSASVAKQVGRDAADVDTTSGLPSAPGNPKQQDETDPTGQSNSEGAFTTRGSLKDGERGPNPRMRHDSNAQDGQ